MRGDGAARRARVIELAASGHTPSEIAAALGVSRRTVHKHLAAAASEIAQLRSERLEALTGQALADAGDGLATLRAAMRDEDAPWPVRVKAAATILDVTLKLWQAVEVEERLRRLEALAGVRHDHLSDHL